MIIAGVVVDVANILQSIGLEVKHETPKELLADCPFCDDGSANLSVNRESGLYKCWRCGSEGGLRRGGNLVHLVSVIRGITHVDATEYIIQYGTFATKEQLLQRVRDIFARGRGIHHQPASVQEDVDRYFNPRHPFWKKRGISRATAERFQLGYDERRSQATIPLFSEGVPIALIRRNDSGFGPKYKFSAGVSKERYLFGLDHCVPNSSVCITEGPIDALKVFQAGLNAVAVMGDTFSTYQATLLLDHGPKSIVLMTDEDMGGEILSTKIWEDYPQRSIYYTKMPKGRKDPGECNEDEIFESYVGRKHVLSLHLARLQERVVT